MCSLSKTDLFCGLCKKDQRRAYDEVETEAEPQPVKSQTSANGKAVPKGKRPVAQDEEIPF